MLTLTYKGQILRHILTASMLLTAMQAFTQNKKLTYLSPGQVLETAIGIGYEEDEFKISGSSDDLRYNFAVKDLKYLTAFVEPHLVHRDFDCRVKAEYGLSKNEAIAHVKSSSASSSSHLRSHFLNFRGSLGYILKLAPDHPLQTNFIPTGGYEIKSYTIKDKNDDIKINNHIKNEGPFLGATLLIETHRNFEVTFNYFYHWLDCHLQNKSFDDENESLLKINQRLFHSFEHDTSMSFIYKKSRQFSFGAQVRYQYISTPTQNVEVKEFAEDLVYMDEINLYQRQEALSVDLFFTIGF